MIRTEDGRTEKKKREKRGKRKEKRNEGVGREE